VFSVFPPYTHPARSFLAFLFHVHPVSSRALFLTRRPAQRREPTVGLQDPEDLVSGNEFNLGDTVRVSENDTDLRRRKTSLGELEDLVRDLLGGGLGPRWLRTSEWQGRRGDTLSFGVHSGGQFNILCVHSMILLVPLPLPLSSLVLDYDLPTHVGDVLMR
jgi:hypothetical protein